MPRLAMRAVVVPWAMGLVGALAAPPDDADWPMYNRDVVGSRHNPAETILSPANVGQLVEQWRFPPTDSEEVVGVVHATPAVVENEVYFGTATEPTFYKLDADGRVAWKYRNPAASPLSEPDRDPRFRAARFRSSAEGILGSALVGDDTVYFGDIAGRFHALDRKTGAARWTLDARKPPFPGAHSLNAFFASPIPADGKLIVAGGALEQIAVGSFLYGGATGRGFVMALDPATGRVEWKYDVGPPPAPLDPPVVITDSWGPHSFDSGPGTSVVWSTPSFDAETGTIFFGTDVNTSPRRPTPDNPRLDTRESCAIIALDVRDGAEKWITQLSPGDMWVNTMRSWDPATGRYKDQSVGDTPKVYTIPLGGTPTKVVAAGCKNGGFYVLRADDGRVVARTPIYTGPPTYPLSPAPDPRMIALPSLVGGIQTGCATDGRTVFTNGIDALQLGSQEKPEASGVPPTAGRVVALSLDLATERWRHERPKAPAVGGTPTKPTYQNIGDPVASGIAVANGVVYFTTVASGKLVALDAGNGAVLREIVLGPVWSGPSVSRGRIYVGTGNTLFIPAPYEDFFPKKFVGAVVCFGLPAKEE